MKSSCFLAISCGASHLASVQIRVSDDGGLELMDYSIYPVVLSSSDSLLWLKACSRHLDEVALRFGSNVPVGFVIPGHVSLAKYVSVPQPTDGKKGKIIAYEAKQNIPYALEEVTWNHQIVDEDELDFELLIGAARTELVEAIVRYSKDSELELRCIEPSVTSLVNCFRLNYPDEISGALLVCIGAKSTELVYIGGNRFYSRSLPFGGQTISVEISEALDRPLAEAEQIKLAAISGDVLDAVELAAFDGAVNDFMGRLGSECVRTKAILARQGEALEIARCFVSGGGSLLPQFETSLSERIHLPVAPFDPLRRVKFGTSDLRERAELDLPFLADAVGGAIGQLVAESSHVDLRPRSLVWQKKFRRQQPFYLLAGVVACGAVGIPIFNTMLKIDTYRQELENLEIQARPLSQLNQRIHSKIEQIERIQKVIEQAGEAAEHRQNWVLLLNELQQQLMEVEDVWIDKLHLLRPAPPRQTGRGQVKVNTETQKLKLVLEGRLIDVENPMSAVSQASYERVKILLDSFRHSQFVESLEDERFDYSVPGILKFDFTLVIPKEVRI